MRNHIYLLLDAGHHHLTPMARAVDIFIFSLISLNVLAVMIESVPEYYAAYGPYFDAFELFSVAIFTIEYGLRVWSAVESDDPRYKSPFKGRLRFMCSPLAVIDLIVLLPFLLGPLLGADLRVLRALRLLRVFRLTRYASSMRILLQVLRQEGPVISAALFVLLMMIIVAASVAYIAEHKVQPEAFGSIPHALWWAVVTMTTIGYGDVVPQTAMGRIAAAVIGIISVGMVALPAGILASGFNEALHARRREFSAKVNAALADGVVDDTELEHLREVQEKLGLTTHEAAELLKDGYRKHHPGHNICPECGTDLTAHPPGGGPPDSHGSGKPGITKFG